VKTFKIDDTTAAPTAAGVLFSELLSGYPLPPSVGPNLQGDLLVLSNPSAFPYSLQNSNVAVVPILLTATSSMGPGSTPSYTLILLDPVSGVTYSIPVTLLPPTGTAVQ
jgi:hypothetical protein